jgi:hypothetical protein
MHRIFIYLGKGGMRALTKPTHNHGETLNCRQIEVADYHPLWWLRDEELMVDPHSSNYGASPHTQA